MQKNIYFNILKEKDIKITPQRIGVLKILKEDTIHFTVEDIYEKSKKAFPSISLATVYSILELFKEKMLVQEIRIDFNRSRFESRLDKHHHFLCSQCGGIFDIDIPECPTLERGKVGGHAIESHHGYFYGVCKNCIKR
jgi:Fur family peroxide stress response transcriptional regulator